MLKNISSVLYEHRYYFNDDGDVKEKYYWPTNTHCQSFTKCRKKPVRRVCLALWIVEQLKNLDNEIMLAST